MTLNVLKYVQLHSIASNKHSSIKNTQINAYKLQICTRTPIMFQSPNLQLPIDALKVH